VTDNTNPKQVWANYYSRQERAKKAATLAAQHKICLTTTQQRCWYEDTWTETVIDWDSVAQLLDKVAPGWDTANSGEWEKKEKHDA
jgi:hypothetical protein